MSDLRRGQAHELLRAAEVLDPEEGASDHVVGVGRRGEVGDGAVEVDSEVGLGLAVVGELGGRRHPFGSEDGLMRCAGRRRPRGGRGEQGEDSEGDEPERHRAFTLGVEIF